VIIKIPTTNKAKSGYSIKYKGIYIIVWDHVIFKAKSIYRGVATKNLYDYKVIIRRLFTLPWSKF
jgi:hypothetical protein